MNSIIEEYIQQNKLCTEYLFPDWNNFLKILYENNGQVEAILWFEYILINQQKYSLGSGGYIDKKILNICMPKRRFMMMDLKTKRLRK